MRLYCDYGAPYPISQRWRGCRARMPCPYQMLSTAHRFGIVTPRFSNQIALLPDDDDP